MIVTCHCFFHPAKKLRSGAIVRFSDNSSFLLKKFIFYKFKNLCLLHGQDLVMRSVDSDVMSENRE